MQSCRHLLFVLHIALVILSCRTHIPVRDGLSGHVDSLVTGQGRILLYGKFGTEAEAVLIADSTKVMNAEGAAVPWDHLKTGIWVTALGGIDEPRRTILASKVFVNK